MTQRTPKPTLTRRTFIATSLGAALAACTDDHGVDLSGGTDADVGEADVHATADTQAFRDATADLADTPPPADLSPDTAPDIVPDIPDTTLEPPFDPGLLPDAASNLFPLYVWSSDPTSDANAAPAIILATRYLGTTPLELVVFRVDAFSPANLPVGPLVLRTPLPDAAPADGFVRYDLQSSAARFDPHADHAFVFVTSGRRSPVGLFRTPPAIDATPTITLGVTSCASHTFRPFHVLDRAAANDLDAFILLGDTTYADDARSLDDYRANWQRNLQEPGYANLRPRVPTIATWDDHEVDDNWNPETFDTNRLAAATRSFFEHTTPRSTAPQIWRSLRFGRTVEVFVLDCRAERRPSTRTSASPLYISNAQRDWLVDGLTTSPCRFKLVANTVSIAKWPLLYLGADDRWQGYAAQRDHVLSRTADVPGVLWVAGDFHFASVHRIDPPDGPYHHLHEVLVGPVAHLNPAMSVVTLTGDKRQFEWLSDARNFGRFTFDPAAGRIVVEHIGTDGSVLRRTELAV